MGAGLMKRLRVAGLVIVLSLAVAGQAWAQEDAACPRRAPSGRAVPASDAVQLALSAITPEASQTSLETAERACLGELQRRRTMIDAYFCVGEARIRLQQLSDASCAFHTAASVASTDPRRRADAYAREGDALSAAARA